MATLAPSKEVVLTRYEDVRAALADAALVRSIDFERFESGNMMERVILMIAGEEHRDRRRVENALFRRETIARYEQEILPPHIESTVARVARDGRGDLIELGALIAVVMSARVAGIDFDTDSYSERERLIEYLHLFARGEALDAATGDTDAIKAEVMAGLRRFNAEYLAPSRARREQLVAEVEAGQRDERELPLDVLTTLLRGRRQLDIDDELLIRETSLFFEAGAHTSTQTFTNALHQLFEWLDDHPQERQRIDDLAWVQRAVHEALRLRPTNPLMRRRAETDTRIGDIDIAAGTHVYLDTATANRDTAVFGANAATFDPERLTPENAASYGSSFGGGIHLCIGRTFAVGIPQRSAQPLGSDHLFGFVPRMVQSVLRHGARPDPEHAPVPDAGTRRWTRWRSYPVIFG